MLWDIDGFRRIGLLDVGSDPMTLVEYFNRLLRAANLDFFTDVLIGHRVFAISDRYEIIRLYGGF
jgi:hypothetical protein